MKNATRIMVSTFGALVGLIGIEHGLGEALQGSVAPSGIMFPSWPDSEAFRILAGEPAISILPNLLLTGILAIAFSLLYIVWAVFFVQRKNGGLALMLLAVIMLLVGGGVFPPILGIIIGAIGTSINAPHNWWRTHLSNGTRQWLGNLWPWAFGAGILTWLSMFPGIILIDHFFGVKSDTPILVLLAGMFGFLFLTIITGTARDLLIPPERTQP